MTLPAAFLTPLRVEQIGPRRWLLTDDLVFQSAQFRGIFVAPRGFQTDFASIPRIAWLTFPPMDFYNLAGVMHDAGYANALLTEAAVRVFLIKRLCDDLFAECLAALQVAGWRRRVMVRAVRIGGNPLGHPLAAHRQGYVSP